MIGGPVRVWTSAVARALVLVGAALTGDAARAQQGEDLSLARTYGSGVHAYFSGDFDRSYDDLTAAIEAGSEDPRSRYFRGLSALRLGRLDEAEADFSEGAALEARALGGWPVSRSLERVQGHDRIRLERHRVRARVAGLQSDREAERKRYSGIEAAQPRVQRGRRPAPLPAPDAGGGNPFAQPDAAPPPKPIEADAAGGDVEVVKPAPEPVEAAPDAQPEMQLVPPAETTTEPAAEPAADGGAAPPAAAEIEDPFGDAGAGGQPPAEAPAAEMPPATEPPATEPPVGTDGGAAPEAAGQ